LIPLALACTAAPAGGASFDCAKAAAWIEQAVCEDETLGRLDESLAAAYREARARSQADGTALERLTDQQRAWLQERDGCKLTPCLRRLYEQRIAELTGVGESSAQRSLGQQRIEESGPHLTISAVYPVLPDTAPAATKANQEIRGLVDRVVDTFRDQAAEYAAGPSGNAPTASHRGEEEGGWEGPDWSLNLDYDTPHQTERYLAIPFTGYEYTGGAHGMPLILPLIIDLATGDQVAPAGLFAPGSRWLGRLSERCLATLQGRELLSADEQWLREGTAPQAENYTLLFPGPDGLTVTFAPYSVAPYATGIQEVLIPYRDLAGLLNPGLFGGQAGAVP
jgi:uncharacterized protein